MDRTNIKPLVVVAVCGGALAATSASAAVTASVTDQASVQATLVGGGIVEDFDGFAEQDFPTPGTQAFNGFTVSADQASGFAGDFAIGADGQLELFLDPGGGNIQTFTFVFDNPVDTFGAQFGAANATPGSGLFFDFDNGESFELSSDTAAGYTGGEYVSLVSSSTFSSFTVTSNAGIDFFTLDNVVTGVVPSPGSAALLGMAGLAATRRRR